MTPPLRVVRIIARLNVGGPARHVTLLDAGLQARGFRTLLAYGDVAPGEASLEELIPRAGIPARKIAGLGRSVSPAADLRAFAQLVRLIFEHRPDVVHTHTAKAGTLGRIAAAIYNVTRTRRNRCVVVHTFHGHVLHGYFSPAMSAVVRAIERLLGLLTDRVFVLSPRQQADIGTRYRVVDASRLSIVPLGLDLTPLLEMPIAGERERNPAETSAPAGTSVRFGFVGRLVPVKNVPLLLNAFALARRELPGASLLLAGDGELRPALEALAADREVHDAVEFAGWCSDLADVYRRMDVVVLTSLNEGTPVAVIEAMAAGLPVVATDVGGVADVVEHDGTGLLVSSGDERALAAAMVRLGRDAELRRRLGAEGRERARRRYSADRLVADVAALYAAELASKRGAGGSPA